MVYFCKCIREVSNYVNDGNLEYVGRMNNQLTLGEIISNLKTAESAHIIPSKEEVKLSLRSQSPNARDFYSKLVYDRIRNKRNPLFK